MRKIILGLITSLLIVNSSISQQTTTNMDSLSYSVGVMVAQNLKNQGLTEVNPTDLANAVNDVLQNKDLKISMEEANKTLGEYMQRKQMVAATVNKEAGAKFLAENKAKEGVVELPSGLQYEVIKEGDGPMPKATDQVTTHYHGTLIDGTVFDSSVERGEPATFPVNGVIQGWVEALQLMKTGSKWRLYVPADLAYGDRGAGEKIGPGTALVFDVELLSIQ